MALKIVVRKFLLSFCADQEGPDSDNSLDNGYGENSDGEPTFNGYEWVDSFNYYPLRFSPEQDLKLFF